MADARGERRRVFAKLLAVGKLHLRARARGARRPAFAERERRLARAFRVDGKEQAERRRLADGGGRLRRAKHPQADFERRAQRRAANRAALDVADRLAEHAKLRHAVERRRRHVDERRVDDDRAAAHLARVHAPHQLVAVAVHKVRRHVGRQRHFVQPPLARQLEVLQHRQRLQVFARRRRLNRGAHKANVKRAIGRNRRRNHDQPRTGQRKSSPARVERVPDLLINRVARNNLLLSRPSPQCQQKEIRQFVERYEFGKSKDNRDTSFEHMFKNAYLPSAAAVRRNRTGALTVLPTEPLASETPPTAMRPTLPFNCPAIKGLPAYSLSDRPVSNCDVKRTMGLSG